jgi:hypothetical protein
MESLTGKKGCGKDVEAMARTPRSLGNQFPPKNPFLKREIKRKGKKDEDHGVYLLGSGPGRVSWARG